MNVRIADPGQVEREIALHEIIAPYLTGGDALNVQRSTDALFREVVGELLAPTAGAGAATNDVLEANLGQFQERLGKQLRVHGGRGRPADFPRLWQALGLAPKEEAKRFDEEASLLFFLTLHRLLEGVLGGLSAEDLEIAAAPGDAVGENADDPGIAEAIAAEVDVATESEGDAPVAVADESLELSQQELYAGLWDALAVELALRDGRHDEDGRAARAARLRRLRDGSARERAIEALRDEIEARCKLPHEDGLKFAAMLTDLVRESLEPQWFSIEQTAVHETAKVVPSAALLQSVRRLADTRRMVARNAPLIAPPLPWGLEGTRHGGYHWRTLPFLKFPWRNGPITEFIKSVEDAPSLEPVFEAVNLIQETPWRINVRVWEVVRALIGLSGASVSSLTDGRLFPPSRASLGEQDSEAAELLKRLREHLEQEGTLNERSGFAGISEAARVEWRGWIGEKFLGPRRHGTRTGPGARLMTRVAMSTVADVAPRQRFWFAWNADTRGRLYPVTGILNPQGDDLTRALLEFADGKPLTAGGARALALHGSAQIGRQQILKDLGLGETEALTLERRVEWIERHSEQIVECARDPLQSPWWREAAKEPFRFLAFCFAWGDYRQRGVGAVCHLPVHVDGTCNGLQHIAALMRDEPLARATNVLPDVRPRDIYEEVAALVRGRLTEAESAADRKAAALDAESGSSTVQPTSVIEFLAAHPGLVSRELAKSVVMIIPYGAGQDRYQAAIASTLVRRVFRPWPKEQPEPPKTPEQQWLEDCSDLGDEVPAESPTDPADPDPARRQRQRVARWLRQVCARHLAEEFGETLDGEFPVIRCFTRELRRAADPVIKAGLPVMWVSPSGLPVMQRSFKIKRIDKDVRSLRGRLRFALQQPLDEVSPLRQRVGILPNFVHSMDAAHLVATARLAKSKGITALSAVHDAFATHAADLETLQQCIRDGFIEVYPPGHSHLNHFVAWCQVLVGLPRGTGQGLPPVTFGATEQRLLELAETLRVAQPAAEAAKGKKQDSGKQAAATPQCMPEQDWIEKVRESAYFFS